MKRPRRCPSDDPSRPRYCWKVSVRLLRISLHTQNWAVPPIIPRPALSTSAGTTMTLPQSTAGELAGGPSLGSAEGDTLIGNTSYYRCYCTSLRPTPQHHNLLYIGAFSSPPTAAFAALLFSTVSLRLPCFPCEMLSSPFPLHAVTVQPTMAFSYACSPTSAAVPAATPVVPYAYEVAEGVQAPETAEEKAVRLSEVLLAQRRQFTEVFYHATLSPLRHFLSFTARTHATDPPSTDYVVYCRLCARQGGTTRARKSTARRQAQSGSKRKSRESKPKKYEHEGWQINGDSGPRGDIERHFARHDDLWQERRPVLPPLTGPSPPQQSASLVRVDRQLPTAAAVWDSGAPGGGEPHDHLYYPPADRPHQPLPADHDLLPFLSWEHSDSSHPSPSPFPLPYSPTPADWFTASQAAPHCPAFSLPSPRHPVSAGSFNPGYLQPIPLSERVEESLAVSTTSKVKLSGSAAKEERRALRAEEATGTSVLTTQPVADAHVLQGRGELSEEEEEEEEEEEDEWVEEEGEGDEEEDEVGEGDEEGDVGRLPLHELVLE